jgi:hypothetical protein
MGALLRWAVVSKSKKTPRDHLVARYGEPPKEFAKALGTSIVPPADWTREMQRIGKHGAPDEVHGGYLDRQNVWHSSCDVDEIYWDWCEDEQKRHRKLFLKWTNGPTESAPREAPRTARFFDKKIGKEIAVFMSGPAPPVNSMDRRSTRTGQKDRAQGQPQGARRPASLDASRSHLPRLKVAS